MLKVFLSTAEPLSIKSGGREIKIVEMSVNAII